MTQPKPKSEWEPRSPFAMTDALEAEGSRLRAELTHEKCLREQAEALCVVLRAHREEYAAQVVEGQAEIARLHNALRGVLLIVDDSDGVAGYHRNGMVAAWSDFREVEHARIILGGRSEL